MTRGGVYALERDYVVQQRGFAFDLSPWADEAPNDDPGQVAPEVDTTGPSSVPIPLVVLGGMSLALLAAGGLGYLSRRRQAVHADDLGDDDTLV